MSPSPTRALTWTFCLFPGFPSTVLSASKKCFLHFGDLKAEFPLNTERLYDLEDIPPIEAMRSDLVDASHFAAAILKKHDYLSPKALKEILEFAFENAVGHGAARDRQLDEARSAGESNRVYRLEEILKKAASRPSP